MVRKFISKFAEMHDKFAIYVYIYICVCNSMYIYIYIVFTIYIYIYHIVIRLSNNFFAIRRMRTNPLPHYNLKLIWRTYLQIGCVLKYETGIPWKDYFLIYTDAWLLQTWCCQIVALLYRKADCSSEGVMSPTALTPLCC